MARAHASHGSKRSSLDAQAPRVFAACAFAHVEGRKPERFERCVPWRAIVKVHVLYALECSRCERRRRANDSAGRKKQRCELSNGARRGGTRVETWHHAGDARALQRQRGWRVDPIGLFGRGAC